MFCDVTRAKMKTCRICLDDEVSEMIQPCVCRGSIANVHNECLQAWAEVQNSTSCEICKQEYEFVELSQFVRRRNIDNWLQSILALLIMFVFSFTLFTVFKYSMDQASAKCNDKLFAAQMRTVRWDYI